VKALNAAKVMKPGSELNFGGKVDLKWVLFSFEGADLGAGRVMRFDWCAAEGLGRYVKPGEPAQEPGLRQSILSKSGCQWGKVRCTDTRRVHVARKATPGRAGMRESRDHEVSRWCGTGPWHGGKNDS
jgi:hypothetical protein